MVSTESLDPSSLPSFPLGQKRQLPVLYSSGVYRIRNIITDECYVGASYDLRGRCRSHSRELRKGNHSNKALQLSFDQHDIDKFVFEVLEQGRFTSSEMNEKERYWTEQLESFGGQQKHRTYPGSVVWGKGVNKSCPVCDELIHFSRSFCGRHEAMIPKSLNRNLLCPSNMSREEWCKTVDYQVAIKAVVVAIQLILEKEDE